MAIKQTKLKGLQIPTLNTEAGDVVLANEIEKAEEAVGEKPQSGKFKIWTMEEAVKANILTQQQAESGSFPIPVDSRSVDRTKIKRKVLTERGWIIPSTPAMPAHLLNRGL